MGLDELFSITPREYRFHLSEIAKEYRATPAGFSEIFFELLPKMDPKVVRLIGYQLWTQGISMEQLYRNLKETPQFLFELDQFPEETLFVLLKYGFPLVIDGQYFFNKSLGKDPGVAKQPWLTSLLDVCSHLGLDLNLIQANGKTLLHEAAERGDLNFVQKLLSHKINPNPMDSNGLTPIGTVAQALNFVDTSSNSPVYLSIIRQLVRYGGRANQSDRELIEKSPFKRQIERNIQAGLQMKPQYSSGRKEYFSLDQIEDFSLIAEVNPALVNDRIFQEQIGNTNLPLFKEAIETVHDEVLPVVSQDQIKLVGWPYYIDDTRKECSPEFDDRPTAESPPPPEEVYNLALRDLPDNSAPPIEVPSIIYRPMVENYFEEPYYVPATPISPLPTPPIEPTDQPPLPSF